MVRALLDFGALPFGGMDRWLEIKIGGNTLSPRQQVTPTPYALFAPAAGSVATTTAAASAAFAGNGGSYGVTTATHLSGSLPVGSYAQPTFQAIAGTGQSFTLPAGKVTLTWTT